MYNMIHRTITAVALASMSIAGIAVPSANAGTVKPIGGGNTVERRGGTNYLVDCWTKKHGVEPADVDVYRNKAGKITKIAYVKTEFADIYIPRKFVINDVSKMTFKQLCGNKRQKLVLRDIRSSLIKGKLYGQATVLEQNGKKMNRTLPVRNVPIR